MATKKKAASKTKGKARGTGSPKVIIKEQPPIKIVIELVVRLAGDDPGNKSLFISPGKSALEATHPSNFSYSFQRQGSTVLNFVVESNSIDNPPDSGDFFTPVLDPNDPQQVRVIVLARQDNPGSTCSLTMKYKGKDVFSSPQQIVFNNGLGGINKLVKLPK